MGTEASTPLFRVLITLPRLVDEEELGPLQEAVPWGWEEGNLNGRTMLTVHCHVESDARRVAEAVTTLFPGAECSVSEQPQQDWVTAWKDFFTPIPVEELFVILPPWLEDRQPDSGRSRILINPKMAFGTGHHATTALCLEALARLRRQGRVTEGQRFLDLGTGSGILGIGCVLLGLSGLGLDIDPVAVANAVENRTLNHIAPERFALAAGSLSCLEDRAGFDLILANILANPLVAMAPDLVRHLTPTGILVLSGILQEQMERVIRAYQCQGLPRPDIALRDEWCVLVWDRSRA